MNWTRWKRAAEHVGDGLDRQRLRQAGHALDQEVAACQQADEHALEHLVLSCDDALDLEDGALDRVAVGAVASTAFKRGWIGHSAELLGLVMDESPRSRQRLRTV